MRKLRLTVGLLLLTLMAWSGGAPATTKGRAPGKAAAASLRSDSDIERDIRARLAKSKIGADKFQVHVQGGVATLEGATDVIQHKGVATRLAKSGGAVAVQNKIQVSEAARERAAKNLETSRRRAQVKQGENRSEAAASKR